MSFCVLFFFILSFCARFAHSGGLQNEPNLIKPPASAERRRDVGQPAAASCAFGAGQHRTAVSVTAPDAIALDGTEVKLAGLIGARANDTASATSGWAPEVEAVRVLSELVLGRTIAVHPVTGRADRYRRIVAQVIVEQHGERRWVQGELLAHGHARAFALPDAAACAAELIAHEREARRQGIGIWANAAYFERAAYRTRELLRLRGTFQIVSGRVRKVSEMKSAIYLNFGSEWKNDFTAGIRSVSGALEEPAFAAKVRALEGKRVRVRGWIDRRNGPYIEIAHPSELEVLDDGAQAVTAAPSTMAGANEERPEQ